MIINGVTLRKLRQIYRLTREEIGALIHVSGRFISYVEKGDRKLTRGRADMLARELNLTPEKLERLMAIYDETTITLKEAAS